LSTYFQSEILPILAVDVLLWLWVWLVPTLVVPAAPFPVVLHVDNAGAAPVFVSPTVVPQTASGAVLVATLAVAAPASIPAGSGQDFTFSFSASGCGFIKFQGSASGVEDGTGTLLATSASLFTGLAEVNSCGTPGPGSPTPTPGVGAAVIPRNIFRPSVDRVLSLNYSVPGDSNISIRIFDRNGMMVKGFSRQVGGGS